MYKFIGDLSSPGIEAHGGGSMYAVVLVDDDVVSSCVLPAYLLTSCKEGSVCVAVGVANCSVKCCASRSESASKTCSRLQSNKLIYVCVVCASRTSSLTVSVEYVSTASDASATSADHFIDERSATPKKPRY